MGFDSDCVLNIQTVAGEYFCPVCRSLIYPNEALQSQCTHLYCKPCLAYVVSTTRACPYDGYLVTEADSKPLTESNKALADTIGMVKVHCLYHRSGCTWEGPLSESTSHCAGCSFGNSAVVCNRCGIQIVHRQVQEHAQNCPVVQPQAHGETTPAVASSGTTAAVDQSQVAAHVGTSVTQAQPSQTMASSVQGQDPYQQANLTAQSQSSVQAAAPTTEQWYQQQQQYYQQYPGYYPYQLQYQQYYPYQQPAAAQQPQSQAYMQPVAAQPQPQGQPQAPLQTQPQAPLQAQPQAHLHSQQPSTQLQSQPQVHSQLQTHSLTQPQPHLQSQTHPPPVGQQHFQAPTHPQTHPVQPLPQQVHMPPYQQPQSQMQHQTPVPTQNPVAQQPVQPHPQSFAQPNQHVNPHVHPQPQPQPQPQHSSTHAVTGHHSYPQFQPQQQMQPGGPHMFPQGGIQLQSQHPVQMQNQFPEQAPPLRPPQPPIHHQYVPQQQQPFSGQALGSVQSHVHQQGAYTHQHPQVQSQLRPQGQSPSFHQPSHAYAHPHQSVAVPHGMQPPQTQNLGGRPMALAEGVPIQPHPYSSGGFQGKPMQVGTSQHSSNALMTNNFERGLEGEASLNNDKRNPKDVVVAPGLDADASEVNKIKTESEIKPLNDENKSIDEAKHASEAPSTEKEHFFRQVKDEPTDGTNDHKDVSVADNKQVGLSVSEDKDSQGRNLTQPTGGYIGSLTLQAPPGSSHHMQFPGHASSQIRPFGPGNIPHSGQPPNPLPEYLQQPSHKQPHGPQVSPGIAGPGSTSNFGRGQGHYETDMFPNQRPNYEDDRRLDPLGKHSSAVKMNGAPLRHGLHDDRWKPLPEEHMNPFSQDPARRVFKRGEFEEDLKHFPRTSDLDIDSDRKSGNHLLSSRPLDRGALGFGPEKSGVPAPRFFPPYHHDGAMHPIEMGERPIVFHEKTAGGQSDISRNRDFFGPTARYDMVPRSPHRDHAPHRFGAFLGRDDVDGADSRRFGDPFPGSRPPGLRSHLHRGEFEGSVQQGLPSHLRRGEHFGPHSLRGHLGEPIGVEGFHGHARMGELPGPRNFFQPQLGEPGYRSNFSLKEYHGDNGSYTRDFESFDNLKRRKPSSMGWCRICKLDCETVEGLDMHSQSRDHQKKALDMVLIIKQNAKKQKLASVDRSSLDDVSKSRISSFEGGRHK